MIFEKIGGGTYALFRMTSKLNHLDQSITYKDLWLGYECYDYQYFSLVISYVSMMFNLFEI